MTNNNSIFDFANQFGVESPFGNWVQEAEKGFATNFFVDHIKLGDFIRDGLKKNYSPLFYYMDFKSLKKTKWHYDGVMIDKTIDSQIISNTRALQLDIKLNKKRATINFNIPPNFVFTFEEGDSVSFEIQFYYEKRASNDLEDSVAIIVTATSYLDFIGFLSYIHMHFTKSAEQLIASYFKRAFTNAGSNPNKLDWIYEQVPDFVLNEKSDESLIKDLSILANAKIDTIGTDENLAIIKLLLAIKDKQSFVNNVNNDPSVIRHLLEYFSVKYLPNLITTLSNMGSEIWDKQQLTNAIKLEYLYGITGTDLDNDGYEDLRFAGYCTYDERLKLYEVGSVTHSFDRLHPVFAIEGKTTVFGFAKPFDPLKTVIGETEYLIPALIAEYFTQVELKNTKRIIAGNIVTFVLPELSAVRFKGLLSFSWLKNAKKIRNIDELQKFLNNITTEMRFQAVDLEKVGIKVLFRGTVRNSGGMIYSGNPNTIANGISTSTDPIRATIFAIESATISGQRGVLQVAATKDLENILLQSANARVNKELEIVLGAVPEKFSALVSKEISIAEARKLIKDIYGIDLPSRISNPGYSLELFETLKISTPEEAAIFYQKIK